MSIDLFYFYKKRDSLISLKSLYRLYEVMAKNLGFQLEITPSN